MANIHVVESHELPVGEIPARLGSFDALLRKYGVHLEWRERRAEIRGVPGVGGHVEVRPTEVEVLVTISRLITMMGLDPVRLERTIRRRLAEALGSEDVS